jgi:hypothetical protein
MPLSMRQLLRSESDIAALRTLRRQSFFYHHDVASDIVYSIIPYIGINIVTYIISNDVPVLPDIVKDIKV